MKPLTVLTVAVLVIGACVDARDRNIPATEPGESTCEDSDGDGYGEGCSQGGDCNDRDRSVHVGCTRCIAPAQGCECDEGSKPVSCYREPSTTDEGTVMCHEGTRYCRERSWSACESIVSYPRPDAVETQAVVNPGATPQHCNDCTVNCFVVRDNLDPVDAGIKGNSQNIVSPKSGGLTLNAKIPDASTGTPSVFDPSKCVLGAAPDQDCDGIPDIYDPYPLTKPFATANPTLFLDVAPGETGTGVVNLQFYLNSADVYFMVDQTASMSAERDQLKADLVTGDVLKDPGYDCADYDFDRKPNNELKNQGIIGAVRCMIRDANFGVGYFREIPIYYAGKDNVTYRNLQDITSSIPSVVSAVSLLDVVGNNDWPEASMLSLYAMVTGNGLYFGPDRTGLAPRIDCPSLSYGYPCFRNNAIPIVLLFTDAQFHQGPANNDYPYSTSNLGMSAGTTTTHTAVRPTNETYATALDLGDLTSANLTMIGDTRSMVSDFDISQVTCSTSDDKSPDAMFKFSLTATKTVTATTFGSDFDTTLSIFKGTPTVATALPAYPNTNDVAASAYAFGAVNDKFLQASGDSSALKHDYSANDVTCGAASDGKDATFTFSLSAATKVALSTRGSSYGTSMALFSGTPVTNSYTAVTNTNNDAASEFVVGSLNARNKGFSGDTSAAGITANYTAKQLGCTATAPADAAPDAVYSFKLDTATRVRVSSEDSALKSVIALTSDNGVYLSPTSAGTAIETAATAYNVGALDDKAFQFTGDTRTMHADYAGALTGCGSNDNSDDAVYKFTLASTQTLDIDTTNSSFDTAISLFRDTVSTATTSVSVSNLNETPTTAFDLGTLNSKIVTTTGASTSSMVADFTNAQVGCNSSSSSRDAVYKFHLNTPTRVRVDTTGSSFDTVASLHTALPVQSVTPLASVSNEAVASAYAVTANNTSTGSYQTFTSTTAAMASNVHLYQSASCMSDIGAKDAVFRLNVGTAGNYEINTEGSAFDTVLGLYPSSVQDAAPPTPSAQGGAGDTKAGAIEVALDGAWVSYTGSTTGLVANNAYSNCSAKSTTPDVYYKFKLNTTRDVVIDTVGSSFDTVLALTTAADAEITCNNDTVGTASQITRTLAGGVYYYVFIKGKTSTSYGNYKITFRDAAVSTVSNVVACDDDSGSGGITSKISASLSVGTYYAVVKGRTTSDSGAYRLTVKNVDALSASNRIACDDDSAGSGDSKFEADLAAGDYFVVVKGTGSSAKGSYVLRVQDVTYAPGFISCNDDYSGQTSRLTPTLPAGTYYLVLRGYGSTYGAYTLTMRDADVAFTTNYACDYNSGPSGTSLIERDLAAGTYRVVVKGLAATDKGAYKLILRDVTGVPTGRLACDATSGGSNSSYIETNLGVGTYTVVMQSSASGGGGAYQLSVRDATKILNNSAPYCNNDTTGETTSKLSQSLTAGTYYALVKGNRTADKGLYQLNIGAVSATSTTFVPPTWAQTKAALNAKSVKVIPVLSCHDDPAHGDIQGDCTATRTQAKALANATGALGKTLQPLVFDIDGNGSGLSKTVVDGIGQLADYLEMNVSVRVVFEPDVNPGFGLTVRAVDAPGDGCSGLVGLEHQRCAPGATPRFELAFQNPTAHPVPNNPKDPNGGYNFRAELIGDQQFIVDRVPIYIIPHDVSPAPPAPVFVPSGSYWQDISATNCMGTQQPDWHDLTWNANIPDGSSISFAVCAGDDKTQLSKCTPTPLCTVTGGRSCSQDSDCPDGYCSPKYSCQYVTGPRCTTDKDCSRGSSCKSTVCKFGGQPVYIGDVLKEKNYTSNLRMQVGLTANTSANTAPIVYDWSLNYFCNSSQ